MAQRYAAETTNGGQIEMVTKGSILYVRVFGALWQVTDVDDKTDKEGHFRPEHDFRKGTIMLCREQPKKNTSTMFITPPVKSVHKVDFFADEIKSTTKLISMTNSGFELKFIHNRRILGKDDLFFVDESFADGPKLRLVLEIISRDGKVFERGMIDFDSKLLVLGAKVRYAIPRLGRKPEIRELPAINYTKKADTFDDLTRHLKEITRTHKIAKEAIKKMPAANDSIGHAATLLALPTEIIRTVPKTQVINGLAKTIAAGQ